MEDFLSVRYPNRLRLRAVLEGQAPSRTTTEKVSESRTVNRANVMPKQALVVHVEDLGRVLEHRISHDLLVSSPITSSVTLRDSSGTHCPPDWRTRRPHSAFVSH